MYRTHVYLTVTAAKLVDATSEHPKVLVIASNDARPEGENGFGWISLHFLVPPVDAPRPGTLLEVTVEQFSDRVADEICGGADQESAERQQETHQKNLAMFDRRIGEAEEEGNRAVADQLRAFKTEYARIIPKRDEPTSVDPRW